eukprot:COSAG06_NODE_15579_length_1060_cov_1.782518_2_plen_53_part_01
MKSTYYGTSIVEHFVFCHPDSSLLNTAVFCIVELSLEFFSSGVVLAGQVLVFS